MQGLWQFGRLRQQPQATALRVNFGASDPFGTM